MIITVKKGRGNKIHISVDDEYRATVDADFWYSQAIRNGDEITEDELTVLLDAVSFRRAYNRAIDIISRRDHCKKELTQKLLQRVDKHIAQEIADRFEELGLINDESYAQRLAPELVRRKGMSPYRIRQELISRGISREIADNAVEELDTDDKKSIINLLNTKFSNRNLLDEKELRRTINALIRLGYQYGDIKNAIDEKEWESDV
ncbi:MAG: regulatory protein RecX [Clostridia bacterium]|nr:regulatory protein RecX [Clostridia bacterium]